jgi:hypothetical protein
MHESDKIKEAGYFLTLLHAKQNEPNEFPHLLSAFLAAARSVTQYALNEADTTPKSSPPSVGKQWYDQEISSPAYSVLAFLRDERNKDIHLKPVSPRKITSIEVVTRLYVSCSADYRVDYVDSEGKPVDITKLTDAEPLTPKKEYVPVPPSYRYEFHDWTGPEDVLTLCDTCYNQLHTFVNDGRQKGFLTP